MHATNVPPDLSGLVTMEEAHSRAKLPKVSQATLARWARDLPIGAVRVGGRWFCDPDKLRAAVVPKVKL